MSSEVSQKKDDTFHLTISDTFCERTKDTDDLTHMLGRLPYLSLRCPSYVLDNYTLRQSM